MQWGFNRAEFGLVFFILALIVGIFLNLNWESTRKEGQLSAYSVFNPGGARLVGTFLAVVEFFAVCAVWCCLMIMIMMKMKMKMKMKMWCRCCRCCYS
jgi:hypothetical protein